MTWVKSKTGNHTPIEFDGDINDGHPRNVQRNGQADPDFFPPYPEPVQCFLAFFPLTFWDKVAEWTQMKVQTKRGYEKAQVRQDDILGVIVIWFISSLITFPSMDLFYSMGLDKLLALL